MDASKQPSMLINAKGDSIRIEGKENEVINDLEDNTNVKLRKSNAFDADTGIKNQKMKDQEFDGSE